MRKINQKVFKIDESVKFYPKGEESGLKLIVNGVATEIDFADTFVKKPEYYTESNEIKGYSILEKYFQHSSGIFSFLYKNTNLEIKLIEINERVITDAKIIKMRNPVVIMDEKDISEPEEEKILDTIVIIRDNELKRRIERDEEEKKKSEPKKPKLYENYIYEQDKNVFIKKGFAEYKNGNFRMLIHKTDQQVPSVLVLLDKLSFEIIDTEKKGDIYEFELKEEKGVAYIENEALIVKKSEIQ